MKTIYEQNGWRRKCTNPQERRFFKSKKISKAWNMPKVGEILRKYI